MYLVLVMLILLHMHYSCHKQTGKKLHADSTIISQQLSPVVVPSCLLSYFPMHGSGFVNLHVEQERLSGCVPYLL